MNELNVVNVVFSAQYQVRITGMAVFASSG